MTTLQNPSAIGHPLQSPPTTPVDSSFGPLKGRMDQVGNQLTPPTSPHKSGEEIGKGGEDSLTESILYVCPFDVNIITDSNGREQSYGWGAWSTVYKGQSQAKSITDGGLPTPPSSPLTSVPQLVAVKRPARRDAIPIMKSEALILSHLSQVSNHNSYVVPFYGVIPSNDSLVLGAVPLSLETYIRGCASKSNLTRSTWTMSEPVIGTTTTWINVAQVLINALAWMHTTAKVVHGDIKPGNILLSPNRDSDSSFAFDPLFADFSSGQLLRSQLPTQGTLSAVTREYTAPELLSYAVLRDPASTATTASDVFSLAVTLLVAATGELMVYPGSVFQRQAMATQGWDVINHVRNGDQGARVPRRGVVDKVLERAVRKVGPDRIEATEWSRLVAEKIKDERRRTQ